MARSQNSFIKHQKEVKRKKKQEEKRKKRLEKKDTTVDGSLDNMMACLDEDGNIVDAPIDTPDKEDQK